MSFLKPLWRLYVDPLASLAEDELQNVEMAEHERTKERNELKVKKRDYTGYDDEEFVDGREGMKRAVLSKYDEFLEGPKEAVSRLLFRFLCSDYMLCRVSVEGAHSLSSISQHKKIRSRLLLSSRNHFSDPCGSVYKK